MLSTARYAATFVQKELCCPGAMTWRWALPTRYTFQRITGSTKKDLILILKNVHRCPHSRDGNRSGRPASHVADRVEILQPAGQAG